MARQSPATSSPSQGLSQPPTTLDTSAESHEQTASSSATAQPPPASNAIGASVTEGTEPQSSSTRSSTVDRLLAERRLKLEKQKREKGAAEKAQRKAQNEAKKAAVIADPTSAKAKQVTWVEQQKERKREAQLERERILRQIEHDKQERKEKEERRKALASPEAAAQAQGGVNGDFQKPASKEPLSQTDRSQSCALQARLFDGSTIRSKFSPDQTITSHIRPWIDEARTDNSNVPYTFKHILTPLPNRPLTNEDEERTLGELGLAPSSTLVLVPVQGLATAYPGTPGALSRGFSAFYNLLAAIFGRIMTMLGTVLGIGQPSSSQQQNADGGRQGGNGVASTTGVEDPQPPALNTESKIRIRTLHDQRKDEQKNEFYNGNQVSIFLGSVVCMPFADSLLAQFRAPEG